MRERKRFSEINNIGFISTRLAGTDGVSLETSKWAEVLEGMGYMCFYFAGELDKPKDRSILSPKAHFEHPEVSAINRYVFTHITRSEDMTDKIDKLKKELTYDLKRFIKTFEIDLMIVENAFAIPINIPLGLALTELGVWIFRNHHHVALDHVLEAGAGPQWQTDECLFLAWVTKELEDWGSGPRDTRRRDVHLELLFDD